MYRSAELRVVLAVAVAAIALGLALLAVAAEWTDLLMLDFREWRPATSGLAEPPRSHVEEYFRNLQSDPPGRRPFRLNLRLEAGGPGFLAAERELPARDGERYCFRVLVSPELPAEVGGLGVAVSVNDAVAWSRPLTPRTNGYGYGYAISVDGIRPRQGKVKIRLELRSSRPQPPASAVHFEYATFRRCTVEDR